MGQVYSAYMNHKVKNEKLLIKLTNDYIKNEKFSENCFDKSDLTTVEGCIKAFLAVDTQPDSFTIYEKPYGFTEYYNCFKATYSWESVLWTWFTMISPALEDGSDLEVDMDDNIWRLKVIDGVAKEVEKD
jgi:hypothetical protein